MCLASTPSPSLRGFQVGPANLGILPCGHRPSDSGSDHFLEAVGSWSRVGSAVARPAGLGEAGQPPSGPSQPPTWPGPYSALEPSPWKWGPTIFVILGCLVNILMDVEAFQCFQLIQDLTLDLEPLDCVTLSLVRSRGLACGGARPAGLGEAGRPVILPNFAQFWCTCSRNQNSSKTRGTR